MAIFQSIGGKIRIFASTRTLPAAAASSGTVRGWMPLSCRGGVQSAGIWNMARWWVYNGILCMCIIVYDIRRNYIYQWFNINKLDWIPVREDCHRFTKKGSSNGGPSTTPACNLTMALAETIWGFDMIWRRPREIWDLTSLLGIFAV